MQKRGAAGISPILIGGIIVVLLATGATFYLSNKQKNLTTPTAVTTTKTPQSTATSSATPTPTATSTATTLSADIQQLGQEFSHANCTGTGTVPLVSPPMKATDIGTIQPMGLMVDGHVTPVDHEYYYGKDFTSKKRDTAEVLAPADGVITEITHRGDKMDTPIGAVDVPSSDEYRFVISYSCTFFSYVDLVTSLDDTVKSKLPASWNSNSNSGVNIPVKAGQVIGRVGGQSLDFAVWDLTKSLPGLLVPAAYNNAEPWKIHTVRPLEYFTADVKTIVLPFYERSVEPLDGKIDYDVDGKLIGTWFQQGTNGYIGSTSPGMVTGYWSGHLSIAANYIDPTAFEFSIGNYPGGAAQFIAKRSSTDPATVGVATGLVKYELGGIDYITPAGAFWRFEKVVPGIKVVDPKTVVATVLVQLMDTRLLKVEVFPRKTATQVTAFDASAVLYTRGDGATKPTSNTAY